MIDKMKNAFLSMLSIILLATAISCTGEKKKSNNTADQREKQSVQKTILAQTPPLGWNSFDSYGITIYEEVAMKEIDAFIEKFAPYGYEYFVIDNGWFASPKTIVYEGYTMAVADKPDPNECSVDEYGIPMPSPQFFPNGLKPMVDKLHAKGLIA